MTIGSVLAKGTGYVGLAAIAYDAHKLGKVRAGENRKDAIAASGLDAYMDTKSLDKPSMLMSKIHNTKLLWRGEKNKSVGKRLIKAVV